MAEVQDPLILDDAFDGSALKSIWQVHTISPSTVTVLDELKLNNNGGNWTGATVFSPFMIPLFSGRINVVCDWMPHKNHYASADRPGIYLIDPRFTYDTYYGSYATRLIGLRLAQDGDVADRTGYEITSTGTSTSRSGYVRAALAINIDETLWHRLHWRIVFGGIVDATLDGGYFMSALLPVDDWKAFGPFVAISFHNPDYARVNTERFKNVQVFLD